MCCLKYEDYPNAPKVSTKIDPPAIGSRVETEEGRGKVITTNGYRRTATILLDSSITIISAWEDLKTLTEEEIKIEEKSADEKLKSKRKPPRKPSRNPKSESPKET